MFTAIILKHSEAASSAHHSIAVNMMNIRQVSQVIELDYKKEWLLATSQTEEKRKDSLLGTLPQLIDKLEPYDIENPLLVVDNRYDQVSLDTLEKAMDLHRQSKNPVVSVFEVHDHPFQMKRCYRFGPCGYIALMTDQVFRKGEMKTRSFPFIWNSEACDKNKIDSVPQFDGNKITVGSCQIFNFPNAIRYNREDTENASLIVPRSFRRDDGILTGVGTPGTSGHPEVTLYALDELGHVLAMADEVKIPDILRLKPITENGEHQATCDVDTLGRRRFPLPFATDGLSGIAYIGLNIVEDGYFEHVDNFQDVNEICQNINRMNLVDITGRQSLPKVHAIVEAFVIASLSDIDSINTQEMFSQCRGVELKREELPDSFFLE